jgi:magnesium transporter
MELSIIGYDSRDAWMKEAGSAEELLGYRDQSKICWINIESLENKETIIKVAETFGIHPLTVEDIADTEQRPKAEEFDNYLYITFKALNRSRPALSEEGKPDFEQISLVLMKNTVLTFQELPGDSFNGIRKRILNNGGRLRKMGADYLAYAIMDVVVKDYSIILDEMEGAIELFEERAIDVEDRDFIGDLQRMKQNLLRIRRIVWPLRENLALILHMETELLNQETRPFFKDVHDGVIQTAETVEIYRELLAGAMEINLAAVSNRMNSVMKVLTIISTIFIPLTFIVGVYGMNFRFMPELELPYAYPLTWGVMILIGIGMLLVFRRRHWI